MNRSEIEKTAVAEYERWLEKTEDDADIQKELLKLKGNTDEITDAFYTDLVFGTSGIRGVLGPGTNRINRYVIRRVTQGLSDYLNREYSDISVVIAFDSRKNSRLFAAETAEVLSGNGIRVHLFSEIAPVSLLSFAIRKLSCTMGIMITASHNPRIFNGYKVYNSEGYQIVGNEPDMILDAIMERDFFSGIKSDKNNIHSVSPEISDEFVNKIASFSLLKGRNDILNNIKVVYTPLNGAGSRYVRRVLELAGIRNVTTVPIQELPDENFTTCPVPNPEKIAAYGEGVGVLSEVKGDLVIATDPDSDRAGALIYHDGMKVLMTGNQLGILMLDYLCTFRPPEKGQFVMKSIVTTPFIDRLAEKHGLRVINTLTGFKYIGEKITELAAENREDEYYFGFEESNGFLVRPFIRDKDGVSSALIIAEMAAWYKSQGKDFIDRLEELYGELGMCRDKTENYFFEGLGGREKMNGIMLALRENLNEGDSFGGCTVEKKTDYLDDTGLPKSNVLEYVMSCGTKFIIRPSGTEPKIKVYYFESGSSQSLKKSMEKVIESFKS